MSTWQMASTPVEPSSTGSRRLFIDRIDGNWLPARIFGDNGSKTNEVATFHATSIGAGLICC